MQCKQRRETTVTAIFAQEAGHPVDVGLWVPALNLETSDQTT